MIVCSCNVLSDSTIRACVQGEHCPRTPGAVYRCLGCSPNCGRCARTVRALIEQALAPDPDTCAACPAAAQVAAMQTGLMPVPAVHDHPLADVDF